MKRNHLFYFFLFLLNSYVVSSQVTPIEPEEENETEMGSASEQDGSKKIWEKFVVGGNIGAYFGNTTFIDISPLIGYKVTPKLTTGLGMTYQYLSYKDPYGYYADYKANVIGPRAFTQYDLIYGIFAHLEYEHLWVTITPEEPLIAYKEVVPGLFPGLGYKSALGENSYIKIMALYNVLWNAQNPLYGRAFQVRFGFSFGG